MRRAYKILLQLYPRDYREMFAAEMLEVFEEAFEERRRHGSVVILRFAVAELIGLLIGTWAEWMAKSSYSVYHSNSNYISGRCLVDRRTMWYIGAARESYYASQATPANMIAPIDETEMCVNAQQRFICASPLKRLFILICGKFLPIHPRMGRKTTIFSRQG